jgi:ABC-type Fe3+ transport system substrate-binding protein
MSRIPRRALASAIAIIATLIVAPALAQQPKPPTLAELATYDGPDRTKRLVEGAKKEGAVTIYSSVTVDDMKVLAAAFEKKYGVKLQAWRASSESILQRAIVENRGGRYDVDAIETSAADMEALYRERLFQEIKTPLIADIVPAAIRPHGGWIGDRLNIISAAYNTNLVRKADLPKSYEDLVSPRWKGKLGIEADDAVWFGALATELGEQKAIRLFRDIVRTNGLSVRKGHTLIANLVVSGEIPLALTVYHYKAEQLKVAGAPLDWFVMPPGLARFLGTGVMRRAPHPHAALLFLDFMLSDAQQLLLDRDFTPTNVKVKPLDVPFKVIDPAQVLDQGDKWQKLYNEIIISQSK